MACKMDIQKKYEVTLSLVVPCYNEAQALPVFIEEVRKVVSGLQGVQPEIILVNDGSKDETLAIMRSLHVKYPFIRYISFSRNFGKEGAILAGLQAARGDYVAVMDADMQDPPSLLPEMLRGVMVEVSPVF